MGRILHAHVDVLRRIAGACAALEAQLAIPVGGGRRTAQLQNLPGSPIERTSRIWKFSPGLT